MHFDSSILNEPRTLQVSLPDSYSQSDQHYPVLYLLDGERHFQHGVLAASLLANQGLIPELIVVGIPSSEAVRARDLATDKQHFIRFLQEEVFAIVDARYRANGQRTVYGHSLAARFSMQLMAEHPTLFSRVIAASPPLQRIDQSLLEALQQRYREGADYYNRVYFTLAHPDSEGAEVASAFTHFTRGLTAHPPEQLTWEYQRHDDQTHISNYYPSLFYGLMKVYQQQP
ncbi:alpha/beta hydrolase-fold protein [Lacimicrobium sp. SS2-24]|uniref:alpha/beta hydrolase n=1 Tax=Lacimicrobium sp. SS2-24 TaxID=2005569 RepID=UPI00143B5BCB|nr:alpha/beta hydrolase-fold protein [Lacimicrobium sp. SS2-24]